MYTIYIIIRISLLSCAHITLHLHAYNILTCHHTYYILTCHHTYYNTHSTVHINQHINKSDASSTCIAISYIHIYVYLHMSVYVYTRERIYRECTSYYTTYTLIRIHLNIPVRQTHRHNNTHTHVHAHINACMHVHI